MRTGVHPSGLVVFVQYLSTNVTNSYFVFLLSVLCKLRTDRILKLHTTDFDVHGSVHRKCIFKYNQQDATLHNAVYRV